MLTACAGGHNDKRRGLQFEAGLAQQERGPNASTQNARLLCDLSGACCGAPRGRRCVHPAPFHPALLLGCRGRAGGPPPRPPPPVRQTPTGTLQSCLRCIPHAGLCVDTAGCFDMAGCLATKAGSSLTVSRHRGTHYGTHQPPALFPFLSVAPGLWGALLSLYYIAGRMAGALGWAGPGARGLKAGWAFHYILTHTHGRPPSLIIPYAIFRNQTGVV
jgi:hypothetical protein